MSMMVPSEPQSFAGKIWSELKDLKERHNKEERVEEEPNPFAGLEKMSVLMEARAFNDSNFVRMHPKRCCQHLVKLLWFATQGDAISGPESQAVFFGVTKLFQSTDGNLRRLVYLFLRAAAESTEASSLIIVTQSLVKDMFNETPLYKGNALRVLGAIVDPSMLGQLERYFRQMISDKDSYVASAALTTSLLLMNKPGAADTIGRWANEVNTVLTSRGDMVQFHALALLRGIKRHDRLAVSKVVSTLMKSGMRSPLGLCLLMRYALSLHAADASIIPTPTLVEFLDACLRHKDNMVIFEAARSLVSLPPGTLSSRDIAPAITQLHMLLTSPRGPLRFAAVRTLHSLAAAHPGVVAKCNDDLESLIGDPNKAVATLAITTLLKTSSEGPAAGGSGSTASVDRLIKQIGGFMSEVGSDELKVTVIQAIHELALRMPSKHRALMAFLANALREEGGYEFKKAILDAVMDCMEVIPEAANEGLLHLCEFIEDCEYTALASRVLHTLGDKGPAAPQPAAFIRYIYNRVILENAAVRASAVTALAKFATRCEDLRPSILPLLQRCAEDDDDEVRDRATMYLRMLGGKPTPLTAAAAASSGGATPSGAAAAPFESGVSRNLIAGRLPLPVSALAKALTLYAMRPGHGPFSFDALPHVEVPAASLAAAAAAAAVTSPSASAGAGSEGGESGASAASVAPLTGWGYSTEIRAAEASAAASKIARAKARLADTGGAAGAVGAGSTAVGSAGASASGGAGGVSAGGSAAGGGAAGGGEAGAAEALYRIPEFAAFGPLFRSSRPVELTEAELEYLVTAQKHVFANHVVLQFTIRNTVPEVLLERAAIACAISDPSAYAHVVSIAAQKVREGHPATAYVALARNPDAGVTGVSIGCELRFTSRECDPATGEALGDPSPETFPIDGLDISPADYVAPTPVGDFRGSWEAAGAEGEVIEQYALSFKTVADAVAAVAETLGMTFCEGTGAVKPGATQHAAYLSGTFLGGVRVLARMQLKLASTVGEVDPVTGAPAPGAAAGGPSSGVLLKIGIRSEDADVSRLLMDCIS